MRNFMASVSAIGAALGLVTALVALFSGAPGEVTSITFASAFALAVIYVLMDLAEEIHQFISLKQTSEKSIGVPGSSEPVEDGTLKELKPANVIAGRPSLIARPRHNRAHWASSPFFNSRRGRRGNFREDPSPQGAAPAPFCRTLFTVRSITPFRDEQHGKLAALALSIKPCGWLPHLPPLLLTVPPKRSASGRGGVYGEKVFLHRPRREPRTIGVSPRSGRRQFRTLATLDLFPV